MTEKELRRFSRKELLEVLIEQTKETTALRETIKRLEEKISSRRITISESGSLAEAVLKLNDVFSDADKAVEQYVENARLNEQESLRILEEARSEAERIIADAEAIKTRKINEGNLYITLFNKDERAKDLVGDERHEEKPKT